MFQYDVNYRVNDELLNDDDKLLNDDKILNNYVN